MLAHVIAIDVDTIVLDVAEIDGVYWNVTNRLNHHLGAATGAVHKGGNDNDYADKDFLDEMPVKDWWIGGISFHTDNGIWGLTLLTG